jgi:arylsulfatase
MRGAVDQISDRALFINYSRMPVAQNVQVGEAPALAAEVKMEGTAVLWKQWRWLENARLYDVQSDPMQERDVAKDHPEIASDLRGRLEAWWQNSGSRANEPQSVVIGHEAENPALLTACEWWNVFVDQQSQVRRGELKEGVIHLEIARDGTYEWELRRWPREAALPLSAFAPATKLIDGQLPDGKSLPIAIAKLQVGGQEHTLKVLPLAEHATFRTDLWQGKTTLQATFCQADGSTLLGAYYVYVRRL